MFFLKFFLVKLIEIEDYAQVKKVNRKTVMTVGKGRPPFKSTMKSSVFVCTSYVSINKTYSSTGFLIVVLRNH